MADAPPPLDQDEIKPTNVEIDLAATENINLNADNNAKQQSDDMFFSTISDPPTEKKAEDMDELFRMNAPKSVNKEIRLDDDDDPFAPSAEDSSPAPIAAAVAPAAAAISVKPAVISTQPKEPAQSNNNNNNSNVNGAEQRAGSFSSSFKKQLTLTSQDDEDEEDRDKFIEIKLSDPSKVGDGMGSYMVYKITTKTNYPAFKNGEFATSRRFSDFLNLYEKLKEKHVAAGRLLPPAPEKDMIGMAKVKMSKEDTTPIDFIEKRRAALERFLNRLAHHKTLRFDPDFRDFIENPDELPKASNTSALSGAGMLKMFKSVTESVTKMATKIEETDQWYDEKTRQIESLHTQFKKLHFTVELLYGWRKDLANSTKDFSKSLAILANSEEQLNLSRALSQLGEIYEKVDQIYADQANTDYFSFAELTKDYVGLLENARGLLDQRVKVYTLWQKSEETLKARREAKTKLEAANKQDKLPTALAEINEWEGKVEKAKEDFENISKTIKEEMRRFDLVRANEFRIELTKYIERLLHNQEQLVKIWEQYLPQVKEI